MKRPSLRVTLPILLVALGVAALLLLYVTRPRPEARPPEPHAPLVRVERVERGPYRFHVRAQGTVVPRTASELIPQVGGEVVWVSPSLVSGGFFEQGEPLLRIDRADAEARLESARAAVARAESEASRAAKELGRQRQLARSAVASEARIDDAENAARVANATVLEAHAHLRTATRDLERTEIRAPYTGRVRSKSVDLGQVVTPGAAIASLYAVDWAEVRLPVPDRELHYLDVPLTYRPEAAPEAASDEGSAEGARHEHEPAVRLTAEFAAEMHEWRGRIVRTEGEIDPRSRTVTLVARVEDPYGRVAGEDRPPLAVGLFVDADIEGRELEDVAVLPRSALRGDDQVLVVGPDERLEMREIELLRPERARIVVGAGLEAGERVLVSPLPGAIDGMLVRVMDAPVAPDALAGESSGS